MFNEFEVPIQKTYAVAYVDVLGVKQKIKADSNWGLINLWELFGPLLDNWKNHERVRIKVFSDNILICEEIDEKNPQIAVCDVLSVLDTIESYMFNMGSMFVRGAVVVDKLHFSDIFVYGKALLKAYNMENEVATFPRIIIDSSIFYLIDKHNSYIALDKDGLYFYDFMQARINKGGSRLRQELKTFKANILVNMRSNSSESSVISKMEWLVNYFNESCLKNNLSLNISHEDIEFIGLETDYIHIVAKNTNQNNGAP